jgi:hypothetical protein
MRSVRPRSRVQTACYIIPSSFSNSINLSVISISLKARLEHCETAIRKSRLHPSSNIGPVTGTRIAPALDKSLSNSWGFLESMDGILRFYFHPWTWEPGCILWGLEHCQVVYDTENIWSLKRHPWKLLPNAFISCLGYSYGMDLSSSSMTLSMYWWKLRRYFCRWVRSNVVVLVAAICTDE